MNNKHDGAEISFEILFSFSLGRYPEVGTEQFSFNFLINLHAGFTIVYHDECTIPTNSTQGFPFLHIPH